MTRKQPNKSKTIWLGTLMCLTSILTLLQGHDLIIKYPTAVSVIGLISGILVIIMRYLTDSPMAKFPRTMNLNLNRNRNRKSK
jgi:hypothetical protein